MKHLLFMSLLLSLSSYAAIQKSKIGTNAPNADANQTMSAQEQEEAQRRMSHIEEEKKKESDFKIGPYDKNGNYNFKKNEESSEE